MIGKRLINTGAAADAVFTPSEHFNTVLYTGNGSTQRIGGYINRGAVFNGSSSYIDLGNNESNNKSLISVSCWFRTSSTSTAIIWNNGGNDSSSTGLALKSLASGVLYFQANTSGTSVTDTGTTTINDGNWHHVVVNYDNGDFNVYLDGNSTAELTGTSSAFTTTANQNFIIGRLSRVLVDYFNGAIDQFRIFNRELTTTEVTTLYGETFASASKSVTDIFSDSSAVALYQLDGNANDTGGASGKFGSAAIFNGSSSYIDLPLTTSNLFAGKNTFTLSLWFNTTTTGRNDFFNDYAGTSFNQICRINNTGTAGNLYFSERYSGGTTSYTTSGTAYNDGVWHNVIIVFNNSNNTKTIYIDGSLETTYSVSSNGWNSSVSQKTVLGAEYGGSYNKFLNGKIDDVRIYSDVLTLTEVGYLYNNTTASIPTDNLEAYYKLDGDARDEQQLYDGTATNVTYAYDGTATNVTYQEATNFSPDLIWIKNRSTGSNHILQNTVAGINHPQYSDATYLGSADSVFGHVDLVSSNGFAVDEGNSGEANANKSGDDYAAWCFNAGEGAAATNNDGTIASTVKANQDAGFSIVKYTGNGIATATVGHGLSLAPELVIVKILNAADNWAVYTEPTGTLGMRLNSTSAAFATTGNNNYWNNTEPTNTVISIGDGYSTNLSSSYNYIAYCFHSVDNYQKIGSYTGNGSTNGTIVETGFEPAFVMIKSSSTTAHWNIVDNKRDTTNPATQRLFANLSNAESAGINVLDFLSNGFQIKNNDVGFNGNNETYIYLAIAADPDTTTPTVENSFDVVTYSGSNSAQSIDTGFKPDLVWVKNRDDSRNHVLSDSIRGAENFIISNSTGAEITNDPQITSLNDNGFSLIGNSASVNRSGYDYVAWVWKAGDHDDNLPQINTEGDIDSIVSVNAEAGFSIVKYTGTGLAVNNTIGHGLSSAPEMIILKRLNSTNPWIVYHTAMGTGKHMELNSSGGESGTGSLFGYPADVGVAPTSTVFTVGVSSSSNASSSPFIAYCFHSVTGYQKVGSYTGTGTTSSFTNFGFEPRWIMIKSTSSGNWWIFDNVRGNNKGLRANVSSQEDTTDADANTNEYRINFLPDGFQYEIDDSTSVSPDLNTLDQEYIYLAIK